MHSFVRPFIVRPFTSATLVEFFVMPFFRALSSGSFPSNFRSGFVLSLFSRVFSMRFLARAFFHVLLRKASSAGTFAGLLP